MILRRQDFSTVCKGTLVEIGFLKWMPRTMTNQISIWETKSFLK
jgi:hypothetical protein